MSELKLRPPKAAKLRRVRSICPIQLSKSNSFRPRQEGGWLQSAIVITLAYCGVCVKWLLVWTTTGRAELKSLCGDSDAGASVAEAVPTLYGLNRGYSHDPQTFSRFRTDSEGRRYINTG